MGRGLSQNRHNDKKVKLKSKKKLHRYWFRGNNETTDYFEEFSKKHVGLNIACRCEFCMSKKKREWKPPIDDYTRD